MTVVPHELDIELPPAKILDVLLFQWHTPSPPYDGTWTIPSELTTEKTAVLESFFEWCRGNTNWASDPPLVLVVLPEISVPLSSIEVVEAGLKRLRGVFLVVAGLEVMTGAGYRGLLAPSQSTDVWTDKLEATHLVNSAVIWVSTNGAVERFLQPKRMLSAKEQNFYQGQAFWFFTSKERAPGKRFDFAVQVCSDFTAESDVRGFRRECLTGDVERQLDLTVVLQHNDDQGALAFKKGVEAYFEAPDGLVPTRESCLLFVNNARPPNSIAPEFGQSRAHVLYESRFSTKAAPHTFWLQDQKDFNYQAAVMRHDRPAVFWLGYKPVYLLNRVAGCHDSFLFQPARAFIPNETGGYPTKGQPWPFEELFPTACWLGQRLPESRVRWDAELARAVRSGGIRSDVASVCLNEHRETIAICQREVSDEAKAVPFVALLFAAMKGPGYPATEPEPEKWVARAAVGIDQFSQAAALVTLAARTIGVGLTPAFSRPTHLAGGGKAVTFMYGGGELWATQIATEYVRLCAQSVATLITCQERIVVLVSARGSGDSAGLQKTLQAAQEELFDGFEPSGARVAGVGDVVRFQPPPVRFVVQDDLEVALQSSSTEQFEKRLRAVLREERPNDGG